MTSKELARLLGVSEATVSFALNDKPGVSEETRQMIKNAALRNGVDIKRMRSRRSSDNTIYLIYYIHQNMNDTSFFKEAEHGIQYRCTARGYRLQILNIFGTEELKNELEQLEKDRAAGVIILGFNMGVAEQAILSFSSLRILIMDNHFRSSRFDSIQIDNTDVTFQAVNYLINKRRMQPGYMHAALDSYDFLEREEGFYKALKYNMFSRTGSIVHKIRSTLDEAYADMIDILESGETLAPSYFCDNDYIAIGAMKALKEWGYRIPHDISFISIDDIDPAKYCDPPLTTIHIPRFYIGDTAANRLIDSIETQQFYPINIKISGYMVVRDSIEAIPMDDPRITAPVKVIPSGKPKHPRR